MATKFAFPDEVLSLFLTDDTAARRLALVLKDYQFPRAAQSQVAAGLLAFTTEWKVAAKEHAFEHIEVEHHPYVRELFELAKGVHGEYVVNRMQEFLREGAIAKTVALAVDYIQTGEWTAIEQLFTGYTRQQSTTFDPGLRLRGDELRGLLAEDVNELVYPTGIKPLDDAHVGPGPKTMTIFIAPPKRGKSWFLIHQGVAALRHRLSVVHITLEMNRRQVARRYVQNLLSLSKRQSDPYEITQFDVDDYGRLLGFTFDKIQRPALAPEVFDRANALLSRFKLYIKEFPTRSIGVEDLRAYLDMLEQTEHLVPDVIILDYADLMRVDAANLRVDTGVLYQSLRGVAMERELALVTASQSNRGSANAQWVREDMVAEDWSKIMTADTVLTYSQTPDERALGLGRIFVSNARDEADKWAVVMSQAYPIGQFCLDAIRMPDQTYWNIVNSANHRVEENKDDT